MKPLAGVRIVDFTRVLSGPYCTAMLVDIGADVIKVEPLAGDDYRHIGPFLADQSSALFEAVNRGKRAISLDLGLPSDREIAFELARSADVVVENFRPGVADKLGIGFAALSKINPRLIYASISGFGQDGPMANRPAFDIIVQAMSGIMSITGDPDGSPTLVGESIADVVSGLFASWAILAALHQRHTTGLGQHVDVSMLGSMLALQPLVAARLFASGKAPNRVGNRHPISAPFGAFTASDGPFMLAVLNDKQFRNLATVIGRPQIFDDPRFKDDDTRFHNEAALRGMIETWASNMTAQQAVEKLTAANLPASEVLNAQQAHDVASANGQPAHQTVSHAKLGEMKVPEQPVWFSTATRGHLAPAPKLDEHGPSIRNNPSTVWIK